MVQLLPKLRDLLAQPPTRRRWDRLCELLEDASAEELPLALGYALDHLKTWPDELREAPGHWLAAAACGEEVPLLTIVRSFQPILQGLQPLHPAISTVPNPSAQRAALLTPATFEKLLALPALAGLRALTLTDKRAELTPQLHSLATSPLGQLSALSLQGSVAPAVWAPLLAGAGRCVERWRLDSVEISPRVVAAFEQAQGLAPWRELTLRSCGLTPEGLGGLLRCCAPTLEALEVTAFSSGALSRSRHLPAAFAGLCFPRLRRLQLGNQDFTPATLALLGDPDSFPALDDLELTSCGGVEAGLEPLLRGGLAERLRELKLGPPVASRFAEALGDGALPQLRRLACFGAASEPAVLDLLRRAPSLERLTLSGLPLTPALSAAIAELPLRELDVSQCTGRLDIAPLVARGRFRPERLRLVACGVESEGIAALAASNALCDLRSLNLAGAVLDDASLEALLTSPCRETLEELLLYASWHGAPATWTLAAFRHAQLPRLHTLSLTSRTLSLSELQALLDAPLLAQLDDLLVDASLKSNALKEEAGIRLWSAAPLPLHIKAMPFAGPWGWGLTDLLRLPPSEELIKHLRGLLREHPPLLAPERAHLIARMERWWPEPLRAEALHLLHES